MQVINNQNGIIYLMVYRVAVAEPDPKFHPKLSDLDNIFAINQ